jgi:hypothetical protein
MAQVKKPIPTTKAAPKTPAAAPKPSNTTPVRPEAAAPETPRVMLNDPFAPISAKILGVHSIGADGIFSDSILLQFKHRGADYITDFISPLFDKKNLTGWRKIVVFAVLDKKVKENDPIILDNEKYNAALKDAPVIINFYAEEDEVFGIGKRAENLFYPDNYGFYDTETE